MIQYSELIESLKNNGKTSELNRGANIIAIVLRYIGAPKTVQGIAKKISQN